MTEENKDNIVDIDITDELKKSYADYALSIIIGRAIPDVRDGLKPVHRRILYSMLELSAHTNKPHKKSARIVGDVIGKYHPHGDSAVYEAMVRMAQPFSMRDPLVDGQGNFGSIDNDPPAAMRYTESRMTHLGYYGLVQDIDKNTVPFIPNYDNTLKEPSLLPAMFPNLLVNGSSGIAVAITTNIPPHNLKEVIDGCICVLEKKDVNMNDVLQHIKGPDFPTGGHVYCENINEVYSNGRGSFKIRGVVDVLERKGGHSVVIKEIPYNVVKSTLVEKIASVFSSGEHLSDIRDESSKGNIHIVLDLKKGVSPSVVISALYEKTQLESSFNLNMNAILHKTPKLFNLLEVLQVFIEFRKDIVLKRTRFELQKAESRSHLLQGRLKALSMVDEVVDILKKSKNSEEAKSNLISKISLSEKQAIDVLDLKLARLTSLEKKKIEDEYNEIEKNIAWYKRILNEDKILRSVIKKELLAIQNKFGSERKSIIFKGLPDKINEDDLIQDSEMMIVLTSRGYIKRIPLNMYKTQKRSGQGSIASNVKENDYIKLITSCSNKQTLLFFTNKGRMFAQKAYKIAETDKSGRGVHENVLLSLQDKERVISILPENNFSHDNDFLVFVTKNGLVKKTICSAYANVNSSGIIACSLNSNDVLVSVHKCVDENHIMLLSDSGKCIRFEIKNIRSTGRDTSGVTGMKLNGGNTVSSVIILSENDILLSITENAYGKKTPVSSYRIQARSGVGLQNMKVNEKTGKIVGVHVLTNENDEIVLLASTGKMLRMNSKELRDMNRLTQGVKLMNLEDDSKIICFDIIKNANDNN